MAWFAHISHLMGQRNERYLPTAFDGSLSMTEKLNKAIEYLNIVIDATNTVGDYVDENVEKQNNGLKGLKQEFEALKLWLENEGLEEKTSQVLNEWFDSGRLAEIINTNVFDMKADKSAVDLISGRVSTLTKYASDYGVVADGVTDNTQSIINAFNDLKDGETLTFPNTGTPIRFDSHLRLANKKNFKLVFGSSKLYDNGKSIAFMDSTTGIIPNGIQFANCQNFEILNLIHDGRIDGSKEISGGLMSNRVPQIDIENCKNFNVNNIKYLGLVGGFISLPNAPTVKDMMRSTQLRITKSSNFKLNKPTLESGGGGGEFVSITDSNDFEINEPTHFMDKANTTRTFWSLLKLIKVTNVKVKEIKVSSTSTGSLIDVTGVNVVIEKSDVDYPNGKFVDITQEWGEMGGETNNLLVKDVRTNGKLSVIVGELDMKFDNIVFENSMGGDPTEIDNRAIKNLTIKNTNFVNKAILTNGYYEESFSEFYKTVNYENVSIQFINGQGLSVLTRIETNGMVRFKGGKIFNESVGLGITLQDRQALVNNVPDLRKSKNKFIFENTHFKNVRIEIRANVEFINCVFENVRFTSLEQTHRNVTVKFVNPMIDFTNVNPIATNGSNYFEFINGSPNYIEFVGGELKGVTKNDNASAILENLSVLGSKISFDGTKINIAREGGGNLTFIVIAENSGVEVIAKNVDIENMIFVNIVGGRTVNTSAVTIKLLSNEFSKGLINLHTAITQATRDKITFALSGNVMAELNLTQVIERGATFSKFSHSGNVGI